MKKSNLLSSLILAALAVPGVAMAADVETTVHKEGIHVIPASAHTVTANVGLFSNYLYRGISQTGDRGAIQGGFDYAHASGVYAGVWGSNISWLPAAKASFELDTYAGYKGGFAEDFSYDVGVLRYNYPGEYAVGATKANTNEIYGAIGWKWVAVKHSHSTSNLFGTANSKGSAYTELNGSYAIEETGITLGAHYGKQTVANNSALDYTDYNVKVSKNFSGIVLGLAYSKTNVSGDKATGVLSLSRSM